MPKKSRSFLVSYNFVNDMGAGFGDMEIITDGVKLDYGTINRFREVVESRLGTDRVVILNVIELES